MLDKKKITEEWFERAKHDIEGARLLFKEGHFTDTIAHLIQQAVEKYLKGFLIFYGWKLEKIHDIEKLITEAAKYRPVFRKYLDFARRVTAYYIEDRYPPGPPIEYSKKEIKQSLQTTKEIIEEIKVDVNYKVKLSHK